MTTYPAEVAKDPCPLRCGRSWHGLPTEGAINVTPCPSIFGAPAKVIEEVVLDGEVAS